MSKNKREARDQKRKAKLKKRAARPPGADSLAYAGSKYQSEAYAPLVLATEVGICEAFVLCQYEITDDDVEAAFVKLILDMRAGPLPPLDHGGTIHITEGEDQDCIIANIRRSWRIRDEQGSPVSRDDAIGVLRTLLYSIKARRAFGHGAQGYLRFVEGSMKEMGISVRLEDALPAPE